MIAKQQMIYNNSSASRDSYGSRSTTNSCKAMWARMVIGVHSSGGTNATSRRIVWSTVV